MMKSVVIVAGGKGARMGSDIPKQFLLLSGKPVLMHTVNIFYCYDNQINIVVVLPVEQQNYWSELCTIYDFHIPHQIVVGGADRFHSVRNGLLQIALSDEKNGLIAIHDGVRPLASVELIGRCFEAAAKKGGAYPIIPIVDTIRKKTSAGSTMVDRNDYFLVQTPQVFRHEIIQEAYQQEFSNRFTDDVSVVETMNGHCIDGIEGEKYNIKITMPEDLILAEAMIHAKSNF